MKKFVVLLLFYSACETIVDIDIPKEETRLVLNGFFNPDSTFSISLFESLHVLEDKEFEDREFKVVEGAIVSVFDDNGLKLADLTDEGSGRYSSNLRPEVGKEYRIEVSKTGFGTVEASDMIPGDSARVSAIQVVEVGEEGSAEYEITFSVQDYTGEDFYEVSLLQRSVFKFEETTYEIVINHYMESEDEVFDDFNSIGTALLFRDVLFDAGVSKITVKAFLNSYNSCDDNPECISDEYFLILRKVSASYYNYNRTLLLQQDLEGNPFAEPVSVYNNITNGFGIFAGYRSSMFLFGLPEN